MNDLYDPGQPPVYLSTTSKRNRNPNWTDGEIIRFLEILSEEEILIDLKANRIKQVLLLVVSLSATSFRDKINFGKKTNTLKIVYFDEFKFVKRKLGGKRVRTFYVGKA